MMDATKARRRRLLPFSELRDLGVPLSRSQVNRLEAAGKFPRRIVVGEKKVAWIEDEIVAFIDRLIAARPKPPGDS